MTNTDELMPRSCGSCFFWMRGCSAEATAAETLTETGDIGACQVVAPVLVVSNGNAHPIWPLTHHSRVCGDHCGYSERDDDDDPPADEIPMIGARPRLRAVSTDNQSTPAAA